MCGLRRQHGHRWQRRRPSAQDESVNGSGHGLLLPVCREGELKAYDERSCSCTGERQGTQSDPSASQSSSACSRSLGLKGSNEGDDFIEADGCFGVWCSARRRTTMGPGPLRLAANSGPDSCFVQASQSRPIGAMIPQAAPTSADWSESWLALRAVRCERSHHRSVPNVAAASSEAATCRELPEPGTGFGQCGSPTSRIECDHD